MNTEKLNNIKMCRIDKGWTQDELCRKAHVAPCTLHKLEQGVVDIDKSGIHLVMKLANALGVPAYKLLNSPDAIEEAKNNWELDYAGY